MARPHAREGDKRLVLIGVKVTEETKETLMQEAKEAKRSLSDYCRILLEERSESTVKAAK